MTRVLYCQLDIFFWETVSLCVSFFNFKEIKTKSTFLFKHFAFLLLFFFLLVLSYFVVVFCLFFQVLLLTDFYFAFFLGQFPMFQVQHRGWLPSTTTILQSKVLDFQVHVATERASAIYFN